jgi:C-terminal processing protease CtpA/Prc
MLGLNDRPQPRPADGTKPQPAAAPPRAPSGPQLPRRAAIEDAGWIAKDVAYIRFTGFPDDPDVAAMSDRFMREHATAKAVIIDSRYNGGGGVAQMNAMLPYLYAKPTVLVQMEMVESIAKARGNPFAEDAFMRPASGAAPGIVRTEHYVVPRTDETRLFGAKAFYLVSGRTASAAEHLALAFKHTGRATLIGETTAGANHFGGFEPIGGGLAVFLPVGRTIDPATGKDWEGTGIVPDVAVAPTLAVQEALRRAGAIA